MRPLKSIWWMDLKLVCGGDNEVWFNNMVEWRFGNGMLTRVWEDAWLSEGSLKNTFPRVFLNSKHLISQPSQDESRGDRCCYPSST